MKSKKAFQKLADGRPRAACQLQECEQESAVYVDQPIPDFLKDGLGGDTFHLGALTALRAMLSLKFSGAVFTGDHQTVVHFFKKIGVCF